MDVISLISLEVDKTLFKFLGLLISHEIDVGEFKVLLGSSKS